jgi:catechol 2,3-dioxygenase-like lactoylglutathione lyase family enzyme
MFKVQGLDHVGLAVRDVKRSLVWYQDVLGLERMYEAAWGNYPGVAGMGDTSVAFFPYDEEDPKWPVGLPLRHIAFRVDGANFEAAQVTLKEKEIHFEFQDHKIVHSIYFSDPDGNLIELTTYLS